MGWCSGSTLADRIMNRVGTALPPVAAYELAKEIYGEFSAMDADCWNECENVYLRVVDLEQVLPDDPANDDEWDRDMRRDYHELRAKAGLAPAGRGDG